MITTVFAGLSVFQIVPIEAEENSFTASAQEDAGTLNAEASAPSDVLPEDAKLIVTPIKNDGNDSLYDDTLNRLNEEAQKENKTIDAFIAYDIQFEKDGKETEPVNGNATVNLKWENPVKPEGVQDTDQISVIHLKNDATTENLTKETDASKNHATTETDANDPLSLKAVTIQSDSYSVYTVVWSRDNVSKINVHYMDENGTEISSADTVDVPQDAGIDTFAKAIDGYTFSSASIDNANVTELKTENGYLWFNDGINWNQASSTDVSLTYTANPVQEETAVPESTDTPQPTEEATPGPTDTPVPTEQPQETTESTPSEEPVATPETTVAPEQKASKAKETTIEGHTDDNKYHVTVTYGKDAGLPEGTTVSVKTLSEDNDEYENAKNAVAATKNTDADTLGMAALDITLRDKNNKKVEPSDQSKVKVNINAADLPDTVSSVDIHHIKESSNAFTGFIRNVYTGSSDKAEEVKKNITVTDGKAVTDFEVSSFSVFTITWTKDNSTSTSFAHSVSGSTDDGSYSVTVNYNDDDKIPEGTTLSVKTIEEDSTEYKEAKNAVVESKKNDEDFDEDRLGMSALDISLMNGDAEVEPQADVQVQIQMNQAPDEAEGLEVQHIQSEEKGIINKTKVTTAETVAGGQTDGKIENKDGGVTAEFKTPSFSIYTITWKKSSDDNTRVGSIRVHYVNDTGADMANATSVPSSDLVAGNEVTLADWANDAQGKTRLTGYTFKEARLETYQSDKKVSKIKVISDPSDSTQYVLQYQLEGSSDWITYTDSVSKQNENNVEVYLVFTQNPTLKLHYVDENGTDLNGGTTDSKAADEVNDSGVNIKGWAQTFDGYTIRNSNYGHLGSVNGAEVTDLRSIANADGSFTMQYKAGVGSWKTLTSNDVYLVYTNNNIGTEVDVYYTDIAGMPIKDSSGNPIMKKLDASTFGTSGYDFVADAKNFTPDGYEQFTNTNNYSDINVDDIPNWWLGNESTAHQDNNNTQNRILYMTDSDLAPLGLQVLRNGRGFQINKISYSNGKLTLIRTNTNIATRELPTTETGPYKVYIMYKPQVEIHDIDVNGNQLGDNRTAGTVGYYGANRWDNRTFDKDRENWDSNINSLSSTDLTANSAYGTRTRIYVKYIDSSDNQEKTISVTGDNINNFKIGWQFEGPKEWDTNTQALLKDDETTRNNYHWKTRVYTGTGASDYTEINGLITDVYMQYAYSTLPVTIHHIDNIGNTIAPDTTTTLSGSTTITPSSSEDQSTYAVDGYTLTSGRISASGDYFYSYTFNYGTDGTWAKSYKISESATSTNDSSASNEIWLVYTKETAKNITIHHIDTNGKTIAADTTVAITDANLTDGNYTITPSTDSSNTITNYTFSTAKYGMNVSSGIAEGGNEFYSFTYTKTGEDSWTNSYTSSKDGVSSSLTEVQDNLWYIYSLNNDKRAVTIHFVDESGNNLTDAKGNTIEPFVLTSFVVDSNATKSRRNTYRGSNGSPWDGGNLTGNSGITNSANYKSIPTTYTFVGEYLGPDFNQDNDKLVNSALSGRNTVQWHYETGNSDLSKNGWYTSHASSAGTGHSLTANDVHHEYITDIYWVYKKSTPKLNVHYVYMDSSSNETNTRLIKIKDDQTINSVGTTIENATTIDAGNNENTELVPLTINSGSNSYQYAGTRIGPSFVANTTVYGDLGPDSKKVYSADGQLMYYNQQNVPLNYLRRNTWYANTNSGRRYILTRSGNTEQYDYSLNDSSHGDVVLNYVSPNTYTASFHGENGTTQYKLTISGNIYQLAVTDWQPSNLTDVYEIYSQGTQNKIWIEDDQKYSGYLIANISSALQQEGTASNKTYTWYKTVTNSSGVTTTSQVSRKLTGQHYNIEYNPASRTWLDVEADEGGLNETDQTSVQYYVELNYTDSQGKAQTLRSNIIDIQYYSQLENGGFETPVEYIVSEPKTSNGHNGYNGSQNTDVGFGKALGGGGQISNGDYKTAGGVWQTTGTGPDTKDGAGYSRLNRDLEIFNVNMGNSGVADSWATSSTSGNKVKPTAADGVQFAELNCEAAGALYQDVVTHPNEQLHYRFSHRARATSGANQVFDSMYLVIMPTKLAMTGSSTGGELKTQPELEAWLKDHGGYDDVKATAEEEKITYQDFDNGILVVKVSSDNYDWHSINVVNGYTAKGGLTRFFFVAGQTSNSNKTTGNFIDGISFTQELPPTKGINLQVNKTFSGLSDLQIASLAGNASSADIEGLTAEANPFTITVSNRHYEREKGQYDSLVNAALQNATLGFDVSGSADSITFTPTATLNGVNQFTGNSKGDVTRNADGSITMTWTFLDLPLRNTDGTIGTDQDYYYKVSENNSGITGYSVTPSESIRVRKNDGTTNNGISSTEEADLGQGDSATFNLTNAYKDNSISDQPQMVITKKFTGVTPSSVDEMLGSGYKLKVTNTSNSVTGDTLILQGNITTPVVRSESDPDEIQKLDVSLTMDTVGTSKDGSITLTWLIKGWGAGTYTIEEEGYDALNNSLSKVTVNGDPVDITSKPSTITKDNIVIGGTSAASLEYGDVKQESAAAGASLTSPSSENQPAENTNLIIAQYTLSDNKRYVVWTPETLGANTSQAIINKINQVWPDANASMSNTDFHSSANPGMIEVKSGSDVYGSLTYDSGTHSLSFSQQAGNNNLTWNNYYSTIYHVSGQNSVYDEPDIRVVNSYEPAVRVLKVSSGENATPLKGAKFRLYTYNEVGGTQTQQYLVKNGSTLGWGTSGNAITFETNEAGIAVSDASNNDAMQVTADLKQGTYYLEETKAPPGYNLPSQNVIAINVDADGIVTQVTDTSTLTGPNEAEKNKINVSTEGNHAVTIDWNSPYYTITVRNEPGVLLPITGGIGVWPFIFTGFALIMFASYLLWRRRRSKLVEEKLMDEIRRGGDRW